MKKNKRFILIKTVHLNLGDSFLILKSTLMLKYQGKNYIQIYLD